MADIAGVYAFPYSERAKLATATDSISTTLSPANGSTVGEYELDGWELYALGTHFSTLPGVNDPCSVPYSAGITDRTGWWDQIELQGPGNVSDVGLPQFVNYSGSPWLAGQLFGSIGVDFGFSGANLPSEASCAGGSPIDYKIISSDPVDVPAVANWNYGGHPISLGGLFEISSNGSMNFDYRFPGGFAGTWQVESLAPGGLAGILSFSWSACH